MLAIRSAVDQKSGCGDRDQKTPGDVEVSMTSPSIERGTDASYQDKLTAWVAGRDPLQLLSETPYALRRIVTAHPREVLCTRPFPGKWTPTEIIGHLLDSEFVLGYRTRLILCEERPTILGMDQDLWVAGQRHNERDPVELCDMFTSLRNCNLTQWRRVRPIELERVGLHNERGPESLALMIRMEAGHDLSHLDQIRRYLAAIQAGRRA
jgi:hypothetical protein